MKKMFAKLGMPSLLAVVFLLSGLFLGASSAQAQSVVPIKSLTGTWKSVPDATGAVTTEIGTISGLLDNGTPPNAETLRVKVKIYYGILADLNNGAEVPNAAYSNYFRLAPIATTARAATPEAIPGVTAGDWQNIYQDMLQLLSQ